MSQKKLTLGASLVARFGETHGEAASLGEAPLSDVLDLLMPGHVSPSSESHQYLPAFPDPNPPRLVEERPVVIGDPDPIGAGRENW